MFRNHIHIKLQGPNNMTYTGVLTLRETNGSSFVRPPVSLGAATAEDVTNTTKGPQDDYDQIGASYYVIAVIFVYGMSIVMLIASHIRRRHAKMQEDKQINKYLHDFQIVKDKQERDNYKALKKGIVNLLHSDRQQRKNHRNRRKSMNPLSMGNSVQDLSNQQESRFNFRRYSFMNRADSLQDPNDPDANMSFGRRLSLGFLALIPSRPSSARPSSCSFNLHSSQNIIEEDEENPPDNAKPEATETHTHTISNNSSVTDDTVNKDTRAPSYIDLPAITITATQARISHQRRKFNIASGMYHDTVPFRDYMERKVQSSLGNCSTDESEDPSSPPQTADTGQFSMFSEEETKSIESVPSRDCSLHSDDDDERTPLSPCEHTPDQRSILSCQVFVKHQSKSDLSVISDNEVNSLIEAAAISSLDISESSPVKDDDVLSCVSITERPSMRTLLGVNKTVKRKSTSSLPTAL